MRSGCSRQTGQSGAVDRMLPRSSFVFRPFAAEAEARASLARRDLRGYFVLTDDYLQTGVVEVYATDAINVSRSDARNAFGDAGPPGAAARTGRDPEIAARVTTPLPDVRRFAVTEDRGGEGRRGGRLGGPRRRAARLHGAVPDVGPDDVRLPAAGHGDREGEQGRRGAARVGQSRRDPRRQARGPRRGRASCRSRVWISMLFVDRLRRRAAACSPRTCDMPWRALLVALPLFLVAFLFFGSLMLGTGSLGSNMREAQQLSMVWSLTAALPMMLMSVLIREPHGLVARVMTWLPLTAGPVIVMRASMDADSLAVVGDRRAAARAAGCDLDRDPRRREAVPRRAAELRREAEPARGDAAGKAGGSVNRDGARGSALEKPQSSIRIPLRQQPSRSSDGARDLRKALDPDRAAFERRTPDQRPISSGAHAGDAWPARRRTQGRSASPRPTHGRRT